MSTGGGGSDAHRIPAVGVVRAHKAEVACVSLSPCGEAALSGSTEGEILLWCVDTRRVVFNLPASCTHGAQGVLQLAFLPTGGRGGGAGGRSHVGEAADFMSMGRDGCIRFWAVFAGEEGEEASFVRVSDLLRRDSATGIGAGASAVAGTVRSDGAAAPRYPQPDADFGDLAFVQRPTSDVRFAWGADGASQRAYTVRCVATLWHSSFSFCKFSVQASAALGAAYLLVPSDADDAVRRYELWARDGAAPVGGGSTDAGAASEVTVSAKGCAHPPEEACTIMCPAKWGKTPDDLAVQTQQQQQPTPAVPANAAKKYLREMVREANEIEGVKAGDVAVPAQYVEDVRPPKGMKTGVPMACEALLVGDGDAGEGVASPPAHHVVCTGYESGALVVTVCGVVHTPHAHADAKLHAEPLLAIAIRHKEPSKKKKTKAKSDDRRTDKYIVVTGGADDTVAVVGVSVAWTVQEGPGGAALWHPEVSTSALSSAKLPKPGASSVAFHPTNARLVAVACWDGVVRVYDIKTAEVATLLTQHTKAASTALWQTHRGQPCLLTASNDTTVAVWDVYP